MHINHVHVYVGLYDINTRFRRSGIGEIIKQMPFTEPIWTLDFNPRPVLAFGYCCYLL